MTLDWTHFSPWPALAGGLLIGLAAALLVLLNGRVLGVSGIVGGLFRPQPGEAGWRIAFLLGMVAAPWVLAALAPAGFISAPRIESNVPTLLIAGLLVGYGTRLGSGCTSGHGVCGLSRLSLRSLVATLGFMAAGFATVYLVRHVF